MNCSMTAVPGHAPHLLLPTRGNITFSKCFSACANLSALLYANVQRIIEKNANLPKYWSALIAHPRRMSHILLDNTAPPALSLTNCWSKHVVKASIIMSNYNYSWLLPHLQEMQHPSIQNTSQPIDFNTPILSPISLSDSIVPNLKISSRGIKDHIDIEITCNQLEINQWKIKYHPCNSDKTC